MKLNYSKLLAIFICGNIMACSPKGNQLVKAPMEPEHPSEPQQWDELAKDTLEEVSDSYLLNDLVIESGSAMESDSLPVYHASHTHTIDIKHIKLDIGFDWSKQHVLGKATLQVKPWFYAIDQIELDAKNFDIHGVKVNNSVASYTYEEDKLRINLGKTYTRDQSFEVFVDYTAKPNERTNIGGSAAIQEDRGLYFINADGSDPNKPRQIWTQGETESNSRWFPVVDKPNVRCTQEMVITVDSEYEVLSNGKLLNEKMNSDGTKTHHFKMEKPHAPYLFMLAIGDFAIVKDQWRNVPLEYWVEKKYEKDARAIYGHTGEMLEFFSNKLDYPFPWPKYSQVVVRDFVSGAMENTTGVIFGDFVQLTERELIDRHFDNEKIVAHEMFHHWFGDLVTCESWSNLTLNEGFANYSEYLWFEHKYGRDVADYHLLKEQQGYINSTEGKGHPLIDYDYHSREDLFDAISYNKGGSTLHMLRKYLGDEAFWAGLNRYLTQNQYSAVETDELRMAFEDVSGQDLNWFFDQWYFKGGMPVLSLDYVWNEEKHQMTLVVEQSQSGAEIPHVYNLPVKVDIYEANGSKRQEMIQLTQRLQHFTFDCSERPKFVNFDADKAILCDKTDKHTKDEWLFILENGPLFMDRWEAINALYDEISETERLQIQLLNDSSPAIRELVTEMADIKSEAVLAKLIKLAESDPQPSVRTRAIASLSEQNAGGLEEVYLKGIEPNQAYSVVGASLKALSNINPTKAMEAAKSLEKEENSDIASSIAGLYASSPSVSHASFFEEKAKSVDFMASFGFFDQYAKYIIALDDETTTQNAVSQLQKYGSDENQSEWRRFASTKAIFDLRNNASQQGKEAEAAKLNNIVQEIISKEKSPILKQYYNMF